MGRRRFHDYKHQQLHSQLNLLLFVLHFQEISNINRKLLETQEFPLAISSHRCNCALVLQMIVVLKNAQIKGKHLQCRLFEQIEALQLTSSLKGTLSQFFILYIFGKKYHNSVFMKNHMEDCFCCWLFCIARYCLRYSIF